MAETTELADTSEPGIKTHQPEISSVDTRTEKEKAEGSTFFRNFGYTGIEIETDAINKLLRNNGLTSEQISSLTVTFRGGTAADRNFHGEIIGGWQSGNDIEIYTTLAANKERAYQTHLPIKQKVMIQFFLHELRHYIQQETNMGTSNTFMAQTPEEVMNDPLEQDADSFAENHLPEASSWIRMKEYRSLKFEDNTGDEKVVGELSSFGNLYNLDKKITIIDPDNPVIYLEEKLQRDLVSRKDSKVRLSRGYVKGFISQALELVHNGKLGIAEYNGILDKLTDTFKQRGEIEFAEISSRSKYGQPIEST